MIFVWFALVSFIALPGAAELGFQAGRRMRANRDETVRSDGVAFQSALLALAGLLVSFTFALAAARFDARKQIMLAESNAIGTTALRTRMLADAPGEEVRALLRQYVDARLEMVEAGADRRRVEQSVAACAALEERIWSRVADASRADTHSFMTGLLVQSTNEMIDASAKHLSALENPLPPTVFLIVILASAIAMVSIGYTRGLAGKRMSLGMLVFPVLLAAVIVLVFDLAHPRLGIVRVRHDGLIRLKQSL